MNVFIVEMCGETPEAFETKEAAGARCLAFVRASGYYAKVHHDGREIMSFFSSDNGSVTMSVSQIIQPEEGNDATCDAHSDKMLTS
jgi:hypothetical protein